MISGGNGRPGRPGSIPGPAARGILVVCVALVVVLGGAYPAGAGEPGTAGVSSRDEEKRGLVDRWHVERDHYGIEETSTEGETLRFALYPGIGVQVGTPELLVGLGEVYVSVSDARSFSVFGGVGIEGNENVTATVFTVGWGGVRRIQVAGRQSGFFGAFLRLRRYGERGGAAHRRAFSLGSEVGGGHLSLALEFGGVEGGDENWGLLVRLAVKAVWSIPLAS